MEVKVETTGFQIEIKGKGHGGEKIVTLGKLSVADARYELSLECHQGETYLDEAYIGDDSESAMNTMITLRDTLDRMITETKKILSEPVLKKPAKKTKKK